MKKVVFLPLAMNQSQFYLGVAQALRARGVESEFISLHERSCDLISSAGFKVYNYFDYEKRLQSSPEPTFDAYPFKNLHYWMGHEREAFWIFNWRTLFKKFSNRLKVMEAIFAEVKSDGTKPTVVQELGGFLTCVTSFFVARRNSLDHYFLEPSFFKGRCLFLKNTFGAQKVKWSSQPESLEAAEAYLRSARSRQALIIPQKDKHHYEGVLQKIFRPYNFRRLFEKLRDRYVLGLQEEFAYPWVYAKKHLWAVWNKWRMSSLYQDLPNSHFVYFPLHVPADMALTIRAPAYLNQCYVIEQVALSLPSDVPLVIKEHPAMVGAIPATELRQLLERNSNISILRPAINNHQVMERADRVYTINSKAGAEAIALGTPVVLFSGSFYESAPGVTQLSRIQDLLEGPEVSPPDPEDSKQYFAGLWEVSFSGEIYQLDPGNFENFAQAIEEHLPDQPRPVAQPEGSII